VVEELFKLVGPYKLYSDTETGADYVSEASMKSEVAKKFLLIKDTLQDNLSCEDYDQEGILDLNQFKDALMGVDGDLEQHVLDFMLWYSYVRSDSVDRLEYKPIIQLIEENN
jgi:hypothetical protein